MLYRFGLILMLLFVSCHLAISQNSNDHDMDNDGVVDSIDHDQFTPDCAAVDLNGISLDSDGDGIFDDEDSTPIPVKILNNLHDSIQNYFDSIKYDQIVNRHKSYFILNTHIPMLLFDEYSYSFTSADSSTLNYVKEILVRFPSIKISITGYSDSIEQLTRGFAVSLQRASELIIFLKTHGVEESRISITHSIEPDYLIEHPKNEIQSKMNRRVDIRFYN